jgi:predicted DNA-binding protein (UPF0251 family)
MRVGRKIRKSAPYKPPVEITKEHIESVRLLFKYNVSLVEISKRLKISASTVGRIVREGKTL